MSTVVPSGVEFANEIKTDRLKTFAWIMILSGCAAILMVMMVGLNMFKEVNSLVMTILLASFVLIVTNGLVIKLLGLERLSFATRLFAFSTVAPLAILISHGDDIQVNIISFAFLIVIFVMGLLMSPVEALILTAVCSIATLFLPVEGVNVYQYAAVAMQWISVLLALQVTGELYQITDWALQSYQHERRAADELFSSRQQLQKSLIRSEALSNRLSDINKQLESAKEEAEEAKEFRGKFLANMSHELRTPLNAIIGFSETMMKFPIMYNNEELPTVYERDLGQIYNSGKQLLFIINDILDLAKIDAGKLDVYLQKTDVRPIVQATYSTARGLVGGRAVNLELNLPDELPPVYVDENRLRQVLFNIYSNAAKYTDEGHIRLTVKQEADELHFYLEDTGTGIPESEQAIIFEEFQQSSESKRDPRSGTGLGLPITRRLLHLMNGRIWVKSEVGKGSCFSFTIPVYSDTLDITESNRRVVSDS